MSDFEARLQHIEELARGLPAREARVTALQAKGATILETLAQIVTMIESIQEQLENCSGVQSKNQQ